MVGVIIWIFEIQISVIPTFGISPDLSVLDNMFKSYTCMCGFILQNLTSVFYRPPSIYMDLINLILVSLSQKSIGRSNNLFTNAGNKP